MADRLSKYMSHAIHHCNVIFLVGSEEIIFVHMMDIYKTSIQLACPYRFIGRLEHPVSSVVTLVPVWMSLLFEKKRFEFVVTFKITPYKRLSNSTYSSSIFLAISMNYGC